VNELEQSHVKVMGSAGLKSFINIPGMYKIVFGGVVKGGGVHGRLNEEIIHLADTEVLLGLDEEVRT
jgi:hypothetical protein